MFSESAQKIIDERFGGDAKAFVQAHIQSRRSALNWNDIITSEKIFAEYASTVEDIIERLLGYSPPTYLTLPYESFLRTVVYGYHNGSISPDEMLEQSEEYIKLIRNKDMEDYSYLYHSRDEYQQYFDYLPEYKEIVKNRLTKFLGYEPKLEHSLVAEILTRECFVQDRFILQEDILSQADIRALTIIKYREVLIELGKEEADKSPLIAMELRYRVLNTGNYNKNINS